ncbi:hypothetical protein [Photobacterium phosphoreum]|jgi:mannose/fructose/N-acetylgalactosamine-specific phosphotransferase system component IIC|uniref:hypothetical protein n=1 Tax=Photobacterium phosphoreum TaxID=659 RepID=UPI0024B6BC50|nr:hypothetical protein [Photobacterium phosphoreum]
MDALWKLLIDNYEWAFSGIGVAVIGAIISIRHKKNVNNISQYQKSGKNSTSIQAGGNVQFTKKSD